MAPYGGDDVAVQGQRDVVADEVEHDVGPVPSGRVQDLRHELGVVGAERLRDLAANGVERGVFQVDRDDRGARHGAQDLDGELAETADTDDDRRRPRPQEILGGVDRVVGHQPGIGEGRREFRVETGCGDDRGCSNGHVLGHPAVDAHPWRRSGEESAARVPAGVLLARNAHDAHAAAEARHHDHLFARIEVRDIGSRLDDLADDLVTESGVVRDHLLGGVLEVDVCLADPGCRDFDQDFTGGDHGSVDFDLLDRSDANELDGFHVGAPLLRGGPVDPSLDSGTSFHNWFSR